MTTLQQFRNRAFVKRPRPTKASAAHGKPLLDLGSQNADALIEIGNHRRGDGVANCIAPLAQQLAETRQQVNQVRSALQSPERIASIVGCIVKVTHWRD